MTKQPDLVRNNQRMAVFLKHEICDPALAFYNYYGANSFFKDVIYPTNRNVKYPALW